jgi:hypothetical protein
MSGSPSASHSLAQARLALAEARRQTARLRNEIAAAGAKLKELERALPAQDPRAVDARRTHQERLERLRAAKERERAAQAAADRGVAGMLTDSVAADVARLSAEYPVVLLPVRLETRFGFDVAGAPVLRVRIFPDEIMADTHEPPLTAKEREAGLAYWRAGWDQGNEQDAWRLLVAQYPAPRAAWIVRALTPSNVASRPSGEPQFPQTEERPQSWTRPAEARVLPDRWLVTIFRSRRATHRATSLPVKEPLALTLSPVVEEGDASMATLTDGLQIDDEIAWTVDYDRAVEAGMAVTMPLNAQDLTRGIERLIVVGFKASLTPEEAAKRLEELLENHHYARGLAFVPQGTPTNNSSDAASGYPVMDPDGSLSFETERGAPLMGPESNGTLFARALGVQEETAAHLAGAGDTEQPRAQAMNEALWPATWNYFLDQLMDPVVADDGVRRAKGHFAAHVRGRGPLPAFRTGATPYGLLPVSSLNRWVPGQADPVVEAHLAPLLRNLRGIWQELVPRVPRVGATGDPDEDLLAVLGMEASTREARLRRVLGPQFQLQLFATLNINAGNWQTRLASLAQSVMSQIGHPEWNPRLARMSFSDSAHLVGSHFVAPSPLSETEGLPGFNYIQWIRTASLAELRQEQFPQGESRPPALLYHLLRHAALSLYADAGTQIAIQHNLATREDQREAELLDLGGNAPARRTVWQRLDLKIPNVTGDRTLGDFLLKDRQLEATKDIRVFHAALERLEKVPTAELDRLFTETLDTCSHRLDAWITSLASKRLEEIREHHPQGSHLAAFGWVENLRPDGARPGVEPVDLGGFIHAPSSAHAATAAILRNAHLTRAGDDAARYAVDLSSSRAREASTLLEAVRQGQPLGAVLGYRFERGLHEGHRPLRLDKYIDPFRRVYPLVADKGETSGEPTEAIAARNVVDGLLLRSAWQKGEIPWGLRGLPSGGNDRAAAEAELRRLDEAVDAVADLLTAESVFQIVRGNSGRAGGVLDSLAQGLRPPDPEVAVQPRTGTSLTHRVAVVLGGEPVTAADWAAVALTPRAVVEPCLDAWAGTLLGHPAQVQCRVQFVDASNQSAERVVTLEELGLRPLDVLALAGGATPGAGVDRHVAAVLPAGSTQVEIFYAAAPDWDLAVVQTFPDLLEVAKALNALLTQGRPLEPKDLVPPENAQAADAADRLEAEAIQRAGQATTALDQAVAQLQVGPVSEAVAARVGFLFGVPETSATGGTEALLAELLRRQEAATTAATPRDKVRAVFGRDFLFLPRFKGVNAAEMDLALAHGPALVGQPQVVTRWVQQVSRVRAPLAAWRQLSLLTTALGRPAGSWNVAQLPHAPTGKWVGLPFASEEERPESGRLSLVLNRAAAPAATEAWVGLILDEWSELIPARKEDTSITFHYDDPGAEAPQAVLIAVPPVETPQWDLDTLHDILHDTLDLAKLRAVDGDLLPLGQLLPAIYMTANTRREAVTLDLGAILQRAPEAAL